MSTVVIVGGSLTGMAAAARLAKVGHHVVLIERGNALGGRATTDLPDSITLPAAWRDLFKKSGRPLEAELARQGLALVPAAPAVHAFADGSTLTLPTDRGEQWATLTAAYGRELAARWRDLLDELDDTWQTLRPLGLEAEVDPRRIPRATLKALRPRISVEHLARRIGHPHLAELIRDVAVGLGSDPRRTPGWCAARLSVERTFGRWLVTSTAGVTQPTSRLVDLLGARLATRGVDLRLATTATRVRSGLVVTDRGSWEADQVVLALDPWTHDALVDHADPVIARAARRLHPVRHGSGGPQWRGWRTLRDLPPLDTGMRDVVAASACSPGGPDPWARLLTGALVAYRVQAQLTGEDIRPTNKAGRQARTVISTSTKRSEELDPE